MKAYVYIETTIPSFYCETRPQPEMVARRNWTRQWWDTCRQAYKLVTSAAVFDELNLAPPEKAVEMLDLIRPLPRLARTDPVEALARHYIAEKVMPANLGGDAMHLALATYYRCHFLLTWNCTHLANAHKTKHLQAIHRRRNLPSPVLATPLELLNFTHHA